MIERRLLSSLIEWKNSKNRKPLILRGARQVGKSTLVDEFAKGYDVYLKLNLDEADDCQLFDWYITIEELINAIYVRCRQKKEDKLTLLFIDEIQNSPKAVAMLRYFYEKANYLHVIAEHILAQELLAYNHKITARRNF